MCRSGKTRERVRSPVEVLRMGNWPADFSCSPRSFADVSNDMRIAREEIFGRWCCALPFKDLSDAVAKGNDTPSVSLPASGRTICAKLTRPQRHWRRELFGSIATMPLTTPPRGAVSSRVDGAAKRARTALNCLLKSSR
jgi:hypothetical protein